MFHRQFCCVFLVAIIVNVYADVFIPAWMDFYSNPTTAPEVREAGSDLTTVGIVPLSGDSESKKAVEDGNGAVLPTLGDILTGAKTSGNNTDADFKINETDGSVSFVGGKKHNSTDSDNEAKSSNDSGAEVGTSESNGETKADSNPQSNATKTSSDVQVVHECSTDLQNMTCQVTHVNASGDTIASDGEKTSDGNSETSKTSKDASSGSENQDGVIVAVDTDKAESPNNEASANSENSKNSDSKNPGHDAESDSDDKKKKKESSSSSSSEEEKDKKGDHDHKER
uniref:Dentin sialophosphoprotein-like n=1 Tax=Panagrellus redivivus TaxID=6233 RepID=A0A7E4W2J9_PANRE